MSPDSLSRLLAAAESGRPLAASEAVLVAGLEFNQFLRLLPVTQALREKRFGNSVRLCSIVNAKSGRCAEDCRFCAQSAAWPTGVDEYPLKAPEEIVAEARQVKPWGSREFSIVTSGKGLKKEAEIEAVCRAILAIRDETRLLTCASLGIVEDRVLARLKAAGLNKFHHNLECAKSYWDRVCTTHPWEEDVAVVKRAQALGLEVCCGGIFGLGESWAERAELAETLRELKVDSVPLNFLNPIPGTPLENVPRLTPLECLKIIALFRLMLPETRLQICGGRHLNLRDFQSWIFAAGADGMMIGNYLTTKGRPVEEDLRMIEDLGLAPEP
jgi:biotin synthase